MNTIGPKVIENIANSVRMLLAENQADLDKAYLKAEGSFGIQITAKLKPDTESSTGSIEITTAVAFVLDRVKASLTSSINENQLQLFDDIKEGKVTISAGKEA
jgi:hypothetical protein